MNPIVQKTAALVLSISMTGCSFFGARLQTITISSDPTGAEAFINGQPIGVTPVQHQVERKEDILVEVRKEGYQVAYRKPHRAVSRLGIADLFGGWILLLPFLGLLAPAAWEHQPGSFGITLDPVQTSEIIEGADDENG